MQTDLDRSDLRILEVLQEHGHLSAAEVGERLGMTASTCWRRVSRLEEAGVIRARVARGSWACWAVRALRGAAVRVRAG